MHAGHAGWKPEPQMQAPLPKLILSVFGRSHPVPYRCSLCSILSPRVCRVEAAYCGFRSAVRSGLPGENGPLAYVLEFGADPYFVYSAGA